MLNYIEEFHKNYLNIDFNGEFFLPTINGKKYLSEEEIGTKIDKNQYEVFKKVKLTDRFENFFRPLRIRSSESRSLVDEFYSDRTRIIYYPGFRRMQQKAQVFSREALLEKVWGYEYYGDVRTVDVTVRRLREKIEDNCSKPEIILTKRGVGYFFGGK